METKFIEQHLSRFQKLMDDHKKETQKKLDAQDKEIKALKKNLTVADRLIREQQYRLKQVKETIRVLNTTIGTLYAKLRSR